MLGAVGILSSAPTACRDRGETTEDTTVEDAKSARRQKKREGAAIIKMIQESQRQGIVGQDLPAFMRIWTDDARLVASRAETPGPYDEVIPIKRVETYWKRRGTERDVDIEIAYAREKATVQDDKVTVTWDTTLRETHRRTKEVVQRVERERWLLRKTGDGFRVYENRVWPLSFTRGTEPPMVYDASQWARLDEAVEAAKKAKNTDEHLAALYAASRFGEGHDVAVKATTERWVNERRWFWRAAFAMNLYLIDDAIKSFQRQLELNENAKIPAWAMPPPTPAPSSAPSSDRVSD